MPRLPGQLDHGRQKGTPNKRTQDARELLEGLGCEPLAGMARIAMDEEQDIELRARMYAELAPYLYPRRKSIEVQADVTDASDFLQLRELLTSYRAWKREHGLPLAGTLPERPPTVPYGEAEPEDPPSPTPAGNGKRAP